MPIVFANPGIFAQPGTDPRPIVATHTSSHAIAVVSIDGSIVANDTATIGIEDRNYSYVVQSGDSLATIRDALIATINANGEEKVTATAAGQFTRIILTAKVAGPDGNGIAITGANGTTASVIVTAFNSATCCASVAGAKITVDNPAVAGEVITIYATGLGTALGPDGTLAGVTGQIYSGPALNSPSTPVDNAQIGGISGNVLFSGLQPGMMGVYQVVIQLSSQLQSRCCARSWRRATSSRTTRAVAAGATPTWFIPGSPAGATGCGDGTAPPF